MHGVHGGPRGLGGNDGHLDCALAGLLPGAVGAHLNNATLAGLLPRAVRLHFNGTVLANAFPGTVSVYLNDVAVGCVVAPTAIALNLNEGVTISRADGPAGGSGVAGGARVTAITL